MKKKLKDLTVEKEQFAYRHYFVRFIKMQRMFTISKDGFHIGWAKTEQEAKNIIDHILG